MNTCPLLKNNFTECFQLKLNVGKRSCVFCIYYVYRRTKLHLVILCFSVQLSCNIDCGAHTFGLGCRSKCGNCSRGEPCDHVNGRCPGECDRGVYGEKCKDGMNKLWVLFIFHTMRSGLIFWSIDFFLTEWMDIKIFEVLLRNIYIINYLISFFFLVLNWCFLQKGKPKFRTLHLTH